MTDTSHTDNPPSADSANFHKRVPEGDDKERDVCTRCGFIDYKNPKIVAGAVVMHKNQVLLCKRAIQPRKGFWTIPAGYMELGETVEHAAQREAQEEALAEIKIDRLLAIYSIARLGQVQLMFRAQLMNLETIGIGPESLEVGLFDWDDIPWSEMAFPTAIWALQHYEQSKTQENFPPFGNMDGPTDLPDPEQTERLV